MSAQSVETEVAVVAEGVTLPGTLTLPGEWGGVVIFAHGSGSSRLSRRNVAVARSLNGHGCGTLLFDLMTPAEATDRQNVFDIDLLARRVVAATRWLAGRPEAAERAIGYFGASTGAAAALVAAAELGETVAAVVSRGGRPDLAGEALGRVVAPTLLLVGSLDREVLELNRRAERALRCEKRLAVIEGASHLFEEPGTLDEAARLAGEWFVKKGLEGLRD